MIMNRVLQSIIQYLTEGFIRIFTPTDDRYPAIGVQPFGGEVYYPNIYLDD